MGHKHEYWTFKVLEIILNLKMYIDNVMNNKN